MLIEIIIFIIFFSIVMFLYIKQYIDDADERENSIEDEEEGKFDYHNKPMQDEIVFPDNIDKENRGKPDIVHKELLKKESSTEKKGKDFSEYYKKEEKEENVKTKKNLTNKDNLIFPDNVDKENRGKPDIVHKELLKKESSSSKQGKDFSEYYKKDEKRKEEMIQEEVKKEEIKEEDDPIKENNGFINKLKEAKEKWTDQ